jgi:urease accessory protein
MTDLPRAHAVHRQAGADAPEAVSLDYEGRFLRRKRLETDAGLPFLVDLAEVVSLDDGDALELTDGRRVAVRAAPEALLAVTGPSLARLAWRPEGGAYGHGRTMGHSHGPDPSAAPAHEH